MANIEAVKREILQAKTIIIAGHINPDGDSIGSVLSLGLGLEKLGKRVFMLSCDGVPRRYVNLPSAGRILRNTNICADLAISVDCGSKELLGKSFKAFQKAKFILEIDHHEFRQPFGDLSFVDCKAAAVGELVFDLLNELNVKISRNIAENILASIIVETNSFRLPAITPKTFGICAKLLDTGINFYKFVDEIFWSKRKESAILTGICLARCKFISRGRIVYSIVTKKDFLAIGGKDEDVDPVADEMRSIKGISIAILFREKENNTMRVSLRSKGKINIAQVAGRFGGGGHFDAAGAHIRNIKSDREKLLKEVQALLNENSI